MDGLYGSESALHSVTQHKQGLLRYIYIFTPFKKKDFHVWMSFYFTNIQGWLVPTFTRLYYIYLSKIFGKINF